MFEMLLNVSEYALDFTAQHYDSVLPLSEYSYAVAFVCLLGL